MMFLFVIPEHKKRPGKTGPFENFSLAARKNYRAAFLLFTVGPLLLEPMHSGSEIAHTDYFSPYATKILMLAFSHPHFDSEQQFPPAQSTAVFLSPASVSQLLISSR